ncbi:MAG: hypothetical protein FJW30_02080 [Acidobacteria bacterium]|nr:hypothetical protein [Acidobacteriota bacterium]
MNLLDALAGGALLLTANRRLARHWRTVYDNSRMAAGHAAWESPAIQTWTGWVAQQSEEMLPSRILPSPMAERRGWLRVIAAARDDSGLLDAAATAAAAADAWALCRQYGISLRHPAFGDAEDTRQFAKWALEFERRVEQRGWLPAGDQEAFLAAEMPELHREVWLDGFDDLSPVRRQILEKLKQRFVVPARSLDAQPFLHRPPSVREGIVDAANWARTRLEAGRARNIGIVVADLANRRTAVESVFGDVFGGKLFNISLGLPLRDWPIVRDALGLLHWIDGPLPIQEAGALLRSPFVRGANETIELELRRRNRLTVSLAETGWPLPLSARDARTPGAWARVFPKLLQAFGWPGARKISSAERQALARWEQLLRELATLDAVEGKVSFRQALGLLDDLAAEAIFQPETGAMPVHILEALQAAGSQFDALWVMGLTDTNWPAAARPHPFIPRSLQRDLDLPRGSPGRELRLATGITERLLRSAPEIVFSVPLRDGDVELRPSQLIASFPSWQPDHRTFPTASTVQIGSSGFESLTDQAAPPLSSAKPAGGTAILGWQAQCPFRAFALARLGAEPLPEPQPGIPPSQRGSLLHDALAHIWRHFQSRDRMARASSQDRARVIEEAVTAAGIPGGAGLIAVERECLRKRIEQHIELDFDRDGFTVEEIERTIDLTPAGVPLLGRIDRIDTLPNGDRVVIDYKSTAPSPNVWNGERPENLQLPLYALALRPAPAALAFAQLKTGDVKYGGLGAAKDLVPGVTPSPDWERQLNEWRRVTTALWTEFSEGVASVTPKDGGKPCRACHLHSLCRVHESRQEGADDDSA